MMPLRLEIIPTTFCTMVKHEKVLNGKIWKKIPMEAFEAFVSTQQTKPFLTTTAGNKKKRQMPDVSRFLNDCFTTRTTCRLALQNDFFCQVLSVGDIITMRKSAATPSLRNTRFCCTSS
jgi:hypothetical protein